MNEAGSVVAAPPRPASRASMPARRSRAGLWMLAVLGLAGVGVGGYLLRRHDKPADAAHSAAPGHGDDRVEAGGGLPVEVMHPRAGGIERTTTQAASVHAFEHAQLFAKVSGYLKVQNVDIGDRVRINQLLAVIDDPEVDKAVEQTEAALLQANARVAVANQKVASAEADKLATEAMVRQTESEVAAKISNQQLQGKQLRRIEGLVRSNAIEAKLQDEQQDRYDVATSDLGVTRASVIAMQAQVTAKAALVGRAKADLDEARADVEIAKANLDKAKVMQAYTRIISPYDGVVTLRSFHRGDFIRSASEGGNVPLLAVARTDLCRVVVPIPDTDVPYLDRGDSATFQVVALPGQVFRGVISRYSESEDPQSRTMRAEVDLPNPDDRLREGMYGRMTVVLQQAVAGSLIVPSSCLLGQAGSGDDAVFAVRDGKARRVAVRVTKDTGVEAEIQGPLTPEDRVITRYVGTVVDGTEVTAEVKPAPAAAGH